MVKYNQVTIDKSKVKPHSDDISHSFDFNF